MSIKSCRAFFSLPVFDLAFRPLFLLASLFGIIALLYWGGVWNGRVNQSHALPATLWHGHEMMFGFVGAVLVGFLLTAVQTWTGLRSIHGLQCALLVGCWLVGRIAMWPAVGLPSWLVILLDSSFFIYAGLFLAKLIYQKKQKRNYFAVVVLLLLIFTNVNFHLSSQAQQFETASNSLYSAVFLITLMMAVIGGRIIPMFTANATQIPARHRLLWLDRAALFSVWLIVAVFFLQLQAWIADYLLAVMLLIAACLTAIRCACWRFFTTLSHPLLWSLHLSYWCIPLGLCLLAYHYAGGSVSMNDALHALTVGGMGGLILSMISRVSLGHTGRPIIASSKIKIAFICVLIAGLVRTLMFSVFSASLLSLWLSILLWVLAYSIFLYQYTPILFAERKG